MRKIIAVIALLALLLSSCRTTKPEPKIEYIERVSTVERTIVERDTVTVTLPAEQSHNETTDTVSTVSTSLATSTARISGGKLIHDIANKPQLNIPIDVPHTYTQKDSICYREKTVEVEVERDFTLGENIKIRSFWWLLGVCFALGGWLFRKPLITLVKRFI